MTRAQAFYDVNVSCDWDTCLEGIKLLECPGFQEFNPIMYGKISIAYGFGSGVDGLWSHERSYC